MEGLTRFLSCCREEMALDKLDDDASEAAILQEVVGANLSGMVLLGLSNGARSGSKKGGRISKIFATCPPLEPQQGLPSACPASVSGQSDDLALLAGPLPSQHGSTALSESVEEGGAATDDESHPSPSKEFDEGLPREALGIHDRARSGSEKAGRISKIFATCPPVEPLQGLPGACLDALASGQTDDLGLLAGPPRSQNGGAVRSESVDEGGAATDQESYPSPLPESDGSFPRVALGIHDRARSELEKVVRRGAVSNKCPPSEREEGSPDSFPAPSAHGYDVVLSLLAAPSWSRWSQSWHTALSEKTTEVAATDDEDDASLSTEADKCDQWLGTASRSPRVELEPRISRPDFTGRWILDKLTGNLDHWLRDMQQPLAKRRLAKLLEYGLGKVIVRLLHSGEAFVLSKTLADPRQTNNATACFKVGEPVEFREDIGTVKVRSSSWAGSSLIFDAEAEESALPLRLLMYLDGHGHLVQEMVSCRGRSVRYLFSNSA